MYNCKVLLSDSTSYKAVVIVSFLKSLYPEVEVYTCDSRAASRFFHTRYTDHHIVLKNNIDSPLDYKDEILGIVLENGIDFFIPVNSAEMEVFMSHKAEFGRALSYWGSFESFVLLNDKQQLQNLCQGLEVSIPQSFDSPADVRFPVVIKPKLSSSSRGVYYFEQREALERYLRSRPELEGAVIQEYISGAGVGYSVFSVEGDIKVGYGHRRIAEYPITGGSSMYRESFHNEQMIVVAKKLLEATKWSGFAMFEYKLTTDDKLYLIEVNPRVWGSINQGLQNGANYLSTLLGQRDIHRKRGQIRTYFSPFVYWSLLLYSLKGRFGPFVGFFSHLSTNKSDINLFKDPGGWLGSLVRLV